MQDSVSYFIVNDGKLLIGRTTGEVEEVTADELDRLYNKTRPSADMLRGGRHDANELQAVA